LNKIDVSIIIISWNTKKILKDCLDSIFAETLDVEFEVIVVDNASEDGSAQMVKNEFPNVILLQNKKNLGFAAANNQAFKVTKGRYVLLLNSDTLILKNAIKRTVVFADKHPRAGVVGCRVLNQDLTLQPTCFMYPSAVNLFLSATYLYKMLPRNRFLGREHMTWWDRNTEREVQVVTGCYLLVRKVALDKIGGLDEGFFMYAEETDFCFRVKKAGWQIFFSPTAEIIHLGGASSKLNRPAMILQARASILRFIRKHKSKEEYHLACFLFMLHAILRIPFWLLISFYSEKRKDALAIVKTYISAAIRSGMGWRGLRSKE
jgi:GT2 family glycosyltransferase